MNKDFYKTNKQMPYTTPESFFDELEEHIWEEVKDGYLADKPNDNEMQCAPLGVSVSNKSSKLRLVLRSFILMTASVALVLIVNINLSKQSTVSINDVDQAFGKLSTDDQAYLLNVYQEDIFINE